MNNEEIVFKIIGQIEKVVNSRLASGKDVDSSAIVTGEQAEGFARRTIAEVFGKERDPKQEQAVLDLACLPMRALIVQQLEGASLTSMLSQLNSVNEFLNSLDGTEKFKAVLSEITADNFDEQHVEELLSSCLALRKRSVDLKLADAMSFEEKRHLNTLRRIIQLLQCLSSSEISISDVNPGPFSGELKPINEEFDANKWLPDFF